MSLVSNIGIGKEICNPFHYYQEDEWDWTQELIKHKLFPDAVWPDCRYSLSGHFGGFMHWYITLGHISYSLYFELDNNTVEAHKELQPYLEYLHSLYPGSLLARSKNKIYLSYKPEDSRLRSLIKSSICEEIL